MVSSKDGPTTWIAIMAFLLALRTAASAVQFAGGTGGPDDPYQIATAEQLIAINSDATLFKKHFLLVADIDLDPKLPGGRVFTQSVIASQPSFSGSFNGAGHTIRNVTINAPGRINVGLFGYIQNGRVENLVLENVTITGSGPAGTLAGGNAGEISSCVSSGSVTGAGPKVGGLVGSNSHRGKIINSRFTGTVSGGDKVGGLAGSNNGEIAGCCAVSDVVGNKHVGGLAGENGVVLGDVVFAGWIRNSYAGGTVHGKDRVGGLVGYNDRDGDVVNGYAAGRVVGVTQVGGLIGRDNGGYVADSFWDIEATSQATSAAGAGKMTVEMKTLRTFTAWGCSGAWTIDEGVDYPRVSWEKLPGRPIGKPAYGGGSGTEDDPYLIYTAEELNDIGLARCDWDKHFKLMADVDLAELGETPFNLIGCYVRYQEYNTVAFTGVLDGNDRTIANFRCTVGSADDVGLIRYMAGDGCVKDLWLLDPNVAVVNGWHTGSLVGLMRTGRVVNCHVEGGKVSGYREVGGLVGRIDAAGEEALVTGCSFEGTVVGQLTVGGLVGIGGAITDCSVRAEVRGDYEVGGLVGINYNARLAGCRSEGKVSAGSRVGGLAGTNYAGARTVDSNSTAEVLGGDFAGGLVGSNWGTIIQCRAQGAVTGTSYLGGLVAYNAGTLERCCATGSVKGNDSVGGLVASSFGTLTDCYATGSASGRDAVAGLAAVNQPTGNITRCYATGRIDGEKYVGGLVGAGGNSNASFWDVQTTGLSQSAAGTGLTTAQMWTADKFLKAGWDFKNVWMICEGKDYPRLRWEEVQCDQ